MSTDTHSARTIFLDALEYASAHERAQFIQEACTGDESLRREVLRLLQVHGDLNSFMNRPAAATMYLPVNERSGDMIGRYKLLEQIGEGGMGVVYVAEQTEPVRRRVALKIIKPGMDTRQVIARFEAERQALAMMDHPNIARVHDGGTTDTGRPYFVMELVRGMPITDYCDQAKLDVRERLELFMTVCHAVQHAHQKGIIHRDLKPSNVMVTLQDGQAVVKVIDFGVAKAINQQLTEQTIYTAFSEVIGTPLYMSPEQAELTGLDVDTRSDVYSLGVLLYELLTGQTPFDRDMLDNPSFDEIRRMIREDEPPRPSHRISTLKADAGSTVSQKRGIDQRQLSRTLKGELDWIVMKSLEKDRNRRYESASAFAADIERHLNDEPITASPASALYKARKWGRRHQPLVWSALVCLLIGLVAIGGSIGWVLRDRASRLTTAERAQAHSDRAGVLHAQGNLAEACIEYQAAINLWNNNPEARFKLAGAYLNMADALGRQADPASGEAGAKAVEILGALTEEFPDNINYRNNLATLYSNGGNGTWHAKYYAAAINSWEKALDLYKHVRDRSKGWDTGAVEHHISTARRKICFAYAACPDKALRRPDRALLLAEEQHRESPGTDARLMFGVAHVARGEWQAALDYLTDIEQRRKDHGTFSRLVVMAIAYDRLGNSAESEKCVNQAQVWLNETGAKPDKHTDEMIQCMMSFYSEIVGVADPFHAQD